MSFLEKLKKIGIKIPAKDPVRQGEPEKDKITGKHLIKKRMPELKGKKIKVKPEEKKSPLINKTKEKKENWFEPEGQLLVDVYQNNGELVIQSVIAGTKPEDLNIFIENDIVLIKGNRQKPEKDKGKRNYFYKECYWGVFSREIILPVEVDASRIKATMEEGILTLRIPKIEREKKRKIVIKNK